MHVDVALEQSAHCADRVVIEVVNTGGPQHTQASLDQGLLGYKQAANSHTRRWGGHGLGLRHTAAMLKLLEYPPLSLTAEANTVTARFSMPYRPCPPSRSPSSACNALDESDACSNGGGGGGGGGGGDEASGIAPAAAASSLPRSAVLAIVLLVTVGVGAALAWLRARRGKGEP